MYCTLSFLLLAATLQYIQPFGYKWLNKTDSTHIIFEQSSEVQLTYNNWKILYYYDLKPLFKETENLKRDIEHLQELCTNKNVTTKAMSLGFCNLTITNLNQHIQEIELKEKTINSYSLGNSEKVRKRRAPLGFIGSIMSTLFGVLDASDAKIYDEHIAALKKDNKFQAELIKKQTLIIEGSVKLQNITQFEFEEQMKLWNDKLDKFAYWSIYNNKEQMVTAQFHSIVSLTILTLIHQTDQMHTILKLLSHTITGEITNLIPVESLSNNLNFIEKKLLKTEELPIDIRTENIYRIFRMGSIKTVLLDKIIMLEIAFPILNRETLSLFNVVPIPAPYLDRYIILQPTNERFITNNELTKYIPLTDVEFSRCISVNKDKLICSQTSPIISNRGEICELTLLSQPKLEILPKNCQIKEMPKGNYIITLYQANTYYFVINEPFTMRLVCAKVSTNIIFSKNGIITIDPGCSIFNDKTIIKTHKQDVIFNKEIIIPDYNFTKLVMESLEKKVIDRVNYPMFIQNHKQDFELLSKQIAIQKDQEKNMYSLKQDFSAYYFVANIIILIIFLLFLLIIIVKYVKPILKTNINMESNNENVESVGLQEIATSPIVTTADERRQRNAEINEAMLHQLQQFQATTS